MRAIDVQMSGLGLSHFPGVPACPMTQPTSGLTNVTDDGWKLAGTGPDGSLGGDGLGVVGVGTTGTADPFALCVPPIGEGVCPAASGFPVSWDGVTFSAMTFGHGDGHRRCHGGGRRYGDRELAQSCGGGPGG